MTTIYFATNRLPDPNSEGGFGTDLSPGAVPTISYGIATVTRGNLAAVTDVQPGLWSAAALADITTGDDKPILVSIHGFDYLFHEAIERAAAVADAYSVAETVIAYSWPSIGEVVVLFQALTDAYQTDQQHAAASAPAIAQFLGQMAALRKRLAPTRRLVLLAHSMGNYALAGALNDYVFPNPPEVIFDTTLLAAADEQADSFSLDPTARLGRLWPLTASVGIYFSSDDSVVDLISQAINDGPRLGKAGPDPDPAPPAPCPLRLVDCSPVDRTELFNPNVSHQYYYTQPQVITDITSAILGSATPLNGAVTLFPPRPPPLSPTEQRIDRDDPEPLAQRSADQQV